MESASGPGPVSPGAPTGDGDELVARLRADLRTAMKARDRTTASALRSVLAAIENASAVPGDQRGGAVASAHVAGAVAGLGAAEAPRRYLGIDDVAEVVRSEVAARQEAADGYEAAGHAALAAQLRAEADAVAAYLGQAL